MKMSFFSSMLIHRTVFLKIILALCLKENSPEWHSLVDTLPQIISIMVFVNNLDKIEKFDVLRNNSDDINFELTLLLFSSLGFHQCWWQNQSLCSLSFKSDKMKLIFRWKKAFMNYWYSALKRQLLWSSNCIFPCFTEL